MTRQLARKAGPKEGLPVGMDEVEQAVRASIAEAAPQLGIRRKWANDWYAGRDLIVLSGAFAHHVQVEFWRGSMLDDPAHLLQGTGKNLRHVKVRSLREAKSPALRALVRSAVELDTRSEPRVR